MIFDLLINLRPKYIDCFEMNEYKWLFLYNYFNRNDKYT